LEPKIENAKFEGKFIQFLLRINFLNNLSLLLRSNRVLITFFSFNLDKRGKNRKLGHVIRLI